MKIFESETNWNPPLSEKAREIGLGLMVALVGGLLLVALASGVQSFGYVFVLGVPFTTGAVIGYVGDAGRSFRAVSFASIAFLVIGFLIGVVTLHLAGPLCGLIAAVMF